MILKEGRNCWRMAAVERAAFLIDGADYFEAFAEAARQARNAIYIAAWDIDSRTDLLRRPPVERSDSRLGNLLNALVKESSDLRVYILAWDFPMLYVRERELLPVINLGWKSHRRINFQLDGQHPIGGSQHQKIVVIDDAAAFCGGIDLTKNRWDTPEHRLNDPRRKCSDGKLYPRGTGGFVQGPLAICNRQKSSAGQRRAQPHLARISQPLGNGNPHRHRADLAGLQGPGGSLRN